MLHAKMSREFSICWKSNQSQTGSLFDALLYTYIVDLQSTEMGIDSGTRVTQISPGGPLKTGGHNIMHSATFAELKSW